MANLLVPDLVAGNFPATGRVAAAGAAQLVNGSTSGTGGASGANVINVFNALTLGAETERGAVPTVRPAFTSIIVVPVSASALPLARRSNLA